MNKKHQGENHNQPTGQQPLRHRPLEALKSLRDTLPTQKQPNTGKQRPNNPPRPDTRNITVWRPDLDKELFRIAMAGVVPLPPKGRSGHIPPTHHHREDSTQKLRRAHAEGDETITVHWHDDGHCEAARKGRPFALEALARFATPEDTLDLHGLEPVEAHTRVVEFVRTRRAKGYRVVTIIHGTGRHAPDGTSILRDVVVKALSEPPGSREIDAFRSGEKTGTLLVALRSR